jgi:FMN phosphatase YigB (HAD superfamily)
MTRIKIAHFLRKKKFYSIALFFCILLLTTTTIKMVRAKIDADANTPSPKNIALVWDIDGVLLKLPEGSIRNALLKHKGAIARGAISPTLWVQIIKLLSNGAAAGQYQALLKEKNPELAALVDEIAHSKEPIEDTVKLIEELAAAGYTQHVASNMGDPDSEFYKKKLPVFKLFKIVKVVSYDTNHEKKPIKKPDLVYFFQLLEELKARGERKPTIIFIDDNPKNVHAAIEAAQGTADGIELQGIVFQNSAQVREELRTLGILTTQSV